jgi:membrane protease YdiL (CAAX protease family)
MAQGYNIVADVIFLLLGCVSDFLVIYFIPVRIFKYFQRNSFKEKNMPVERKIISEGMIPLLFLLGLSLTYIGYIVNATAVNSLTDYVGFGEDYLFLSGMKYGYQIVIFMISIAVLPAIFEELVFRKTLCDALAPYGPKTAIIVTSVLFSLMHTNFSRILHTFIMGFFCAWLYIGTKNIKWAMLLHFFNNLFSGIETVIAYRVSTNAAINFNGIRLLAFIVIAIVCFIKLKNKRQEQCLSEVREARENGEYEEYLEKKRKYANHIEMLPDEEGNEVLSLSKQDKIKGFFSPLMIAFIVAVLIQMYYYLTFLLV